MLFDYLLSTLPLKPTISRFQLNNTQINSLPDILLFLSHQLINHTILREDRPQAILGHPITWFCSLLNL